ncbi:MAG: S8 family serine peptidase [Bacteroidia bacterium]
MKKIVIALLIGLIAPAQIWSQTPAAAAPSRYWIQFKDKNASPYSTSNPLAFMSPRAVQRRLNQSIPVNYSDLPVNQRYIDSIVVRGAHIHCRSKWLNGVIVQVSSPAQLASIMSLPFVAGNTAVGALANAGNNGNRKIKEEQKRKELQNGGIPAVTSLNYGPSLNQINMLQGVCLHDQGFQGQGMVIAVLDAGFQHADTLKVFDSLRVNHQILGGRNFVDENDSVYKKHIHGTAVLSDMGGNMPGQIIGTAPKASYWLFITEDVNSEYVVEEYNWAAGAEFADSVGADVINTSLGYTTFDDSTENHTYANMNGHTTPGARAANFAANKGIAVVAAAGNLGQSPWRHIGTPADADSVLAVGSVNSSGVYSSFSSQGPDYGGLIKPAVAAQGEGSITADWNSNGILTENGTSFASPITCGLVACLWQAHPGAGNMQILHAVEQSASQFSHPDSLLGYGIPDFCAANLSLGINEHKIRPTDALSNLYPNPFSDSFEFLFWSSQNQRICINITDLSGRDIIQQWQDSSAQQYQSVILRNLSGLEPGMYFLTVRTSHAVIARKLLKQ